MNAVPEAAPGRVLARRGRSHSVLALILLALGALLAVLLAVGIGSVPIGFAKLWAIVQGGGDALDRTLVFELRLPRALAAFATGGLLGVAGALMQVLLRNPLADPYVLGLSGGAAVGALGAMLLGAASGIVTGSALLGALASILLVFGLAHGSGSWTAARLLLTGVVVASGWGAIVTFLLAIAPSEQIPGMLYWLMGDLIYARSPWLALGVLAGASVLLLPLGRALNVLARGPLQAAALGVAVRPLTWSVYLLASALTAAAVTTSGSVGFVGLVVPHLLRLVLGNDQRVILPAAALGGGMLLTLADTVARTLLAPEQLPVGVITAALGVPLFLYLLYRAK
jgi:iron complex transport system permease protein